MKQFLYKYMGYKIFFEHISYNCPQLHLYGYSSEDNLKKAIVKQLLKKSQRALYGKEK